MLVLAFCASPLTEGQTTSASRAPASYIPDDDVIIVPSDNKMSFYQQYIASDKSEVVIESRNQLRIWNENQIFADQYGMDSTLAGSSFFVPTPEEKWEYFKDRYLRYLRRRGEQPIKDTPREWYQDYRASNRVDSIDEMEARFKATNKTTSTGKLLPESLREKEVSLWKQTRFIFQPRVDQGLVIVGVRAPMVFARAWVGVNGRTEFNLQHTIDSIGFRMMYNYEVDTKKQFVSLDQRLIENLYVRVTSTRNPIVEAAQNVRQVQVTDQSAATRDDTLMLLYAKQF
jgi:hypothetical protein